MRMIEGQAVYQRPAGGIRRITAATFLWEHDPVELFRISLADLSPAMAANPKLKGFPAFYAVMGDTVMVWPTPEDGGALVFEME